MTVIELIAVTAVLENKIFKRVAKAHFCPQEMSFKGSHGVAGCVSAV